MMSVLNIPAELHFLAPTIAEPMIRVGRNIDGGYVIPKEVLSKVDTLISFGISSDWSFEEDCQRINPNLRIHAYDHTISEKGFRTDFSKWLRKFLRGKESIQNWKSKQALLNSYRSFFKGNNKHFQERIHNRLDEANDATIDKIFGRTNSNKIFLKIDIEGSEYRIIQDLLKYSERIKAIVIEFHDTDPLRLVFLSAIQALQNTFEIVHLHANNFGGVAIDGLPGVLEITFVPKSTQHLEKRRELPIPSLDFPNTKDREDYKLIFNL